MWRHLYHTADWPFRVPPRTIGRFGIGICPDCDALLVFARPRIANTLPATVTSLRLSGMPKMSEQKTINKQVRELERRAEKLHSIVELAPRAFVVEFAGTPKSGKSTSVEAIRHFFRRFGFSVHVLSERAAQCPIPMKGHLFFNTWCATTMLAELLENVDTKTDIIIADRGLFDALIWFQTQAERGELLDEELKHIESFLLMDRWKNLFNLIAVLHASAITALKRENANRITERTGSIMNTSMLDTLSDAVDKAIKLYENEFNKVIRIDTDIGDVRSVNVGLLSQILDHFESFVNPEILVVPKHAVEGLLSTAPFAFIPDDESDRIQEIIETNGRYRRRTEVESDMDFVQIIPCGVLLHEQRVFLFQRHDKSPKSRLYGKATIWQGCHVTRPTDQIQSMCAVLAALESRVAQSLFISRKLHSGFVGYTWDDSETGDGRHLGLIYRMDIESPELAESLRKKEFRRSRGHSLTGGFREIEELVSNMDEVDLEPWSRAIHSHRGQLLG